MKMSKNIEWKKSEFNFDELNKLNPQKLAAIETLNNYILNDKDKLKEWAIEGGLKGGNTNKESGHMSSLGKDWGKINGNHPNSIKASSEIGKKWGKINIEKITKEDRVRGGKTAGKKRVLKDDWKDMQLLAAKISTENRIKRKIEKYKEILDSIPNNQFTTGEAKIACENFNYKSWKKFLKEETLIKQIHKGANQNNPSIYEKIK
jgi:hypothetical protein